MAPLRRPWRIVFLAAAIVIFLSFYNRHIISGTSQSLSAQPGILVFDNSTTVIVAARSVDNVQWIESMSSNVWKYEVDNSNARHAVPKNKGNEAMVYLTHIINEYDSLTDRLLFLHAGRYQWHNDDPHYDGQAILQNLQLPYLDQEGYLSLRCHWFQGCPSELKPLTPHDNVSDEDRDPAKNNFALEQFYAAEFPVLFPGDPIPSTVAAGCCSQFGVTASAIRRNPREHYVRIRDWLLQTEKPDYVTGRILEYSWHILFGKPAVHCPSAEECYCKVFGKCGLACDEGDCGMYQYPINIGSMKKFLWRIRHAFW